MTGKITETKQRLDALTSLRFFAAVMIVILHSKGLFGFKEDRVPLVAWGQGVSFFFVLSGFILAYVYPKFETWPKIRQFWLARIARIWPGLLMSFILAFLLLQLSWDSKTALANIFMVNAWIPLSKYYFSYNSPSWSISTEFFFYLVFPLLVLRWNVTGWKKLLGAAMVVALLIIVSNVLNLQPHTGAVTDGITSTALLYISPLGRIFEFVLGIFVAGCWRQNVENVQWSKLRGTLYESSALLLVVLSTHFASALIAWIARNWPNPALSVWLAGSSSMLAFGLLIYVMAMGRGWITAWLSHPILVVLGEISFSLYLLHQIVIRYYLANYISFSKWSDSLLLLVFWVVILLASYLMWALVEMPGRRLILGQKTRGMHGTQVMKASWYDHFGLNRKTVWAASVLACLLVSIYFSMGNLNRIDASDANMMTPPELQSIVGTRFGDRFVLRGVKIVRDQNGMHIDFAWESLVEQKLGFTNAVHLTDGGGNILAQHDYNQPFSRLAIKQGTIWKDSISIPLDKLKGGESRLAIALFPQGHPEHLLVVDRGDRDWGDRRMFIDL